MHQVRFLGAGLYEDHRRFLVFECCATTLEALLDVAEKPPALTAGSSGGGGSRGGGGGGGHPHWASKLNPFAAPARPQVDRGLGLDLRGSVCGFGCGGLSLWKGLLREVLDFQRNVT